MPPGDAPVGLRMVPSGMGSHRIVRKGAGSEAPQFSGHATPLARSCDNTVQAADVDQRFNDILDLHPSCSVVIVCFELSRLTGVELVSALSFRIVSSVRPTFRRGQLGGLILGSGYTECPRID